MKKNKRFSWKRLLTLTGFVVLSMWLFSCKPNENEGGKDWATVSLDIDRSGPAQNGNAAAAVLPTGFSSMIVAVPENVTSVTSTDYITEFYGRAMLSTDGSVELTLPLDTPMRVVQVTFPVSYSLADILASTPPALFYGVSGDTITVSGGAQTVAVTIGLTAMDFFVYVTTAGLLSPTGLSVQNNGGDALSISMNGVQKFQTTLVYGDPYNVTIASQPTLGKCVVANGSGTVSFDTTPMAKVFCLMGGAVMGTMTNPPNLAALNGLLTESDAGVTSFAGNPAPGLVDDTGTDALFDTPNKVTTDGTNLYVADTGNNAIRKVVIATQEVTTLVGTDANFNQPKGITTDGMNLYVVDSSNHLIRKVVIATGVVTTLAGTGISGGADGTGTTAEFNTPEGITTDGTSLYVADTTNHTIRKINIATKVVSTLAGQQGSPGWNDAIGTAAQFVTPGGITTDGNVLYVADTGTATIRKITGISDPTDGVVSTLAGQYGSNMSMDNATGTSASFNYPVGITTDGTNLFVTGRDSHNIRKITDLTGLAGVTTLAGSTSATFADGTGTAASFNTPYGIVSDGTNLYITDSNNHSIRKIEKIHSEKNLS